MLSQQAMAVCLCGHGWLASWGAGEAGWLEVAGARRSERHDDGTEEPESGCGLKQKDMGSASDCAGPKNT